MVAPLNLEEGQSSTRPPHFNGQFYNWWKIRMHDFLIAEDSELWDIVLDGPLILIVEVEVKDGEITKVVLKTRQQYNEADRKKIEKSYRAKKLLVCGICVEEYNRISACESAKEIWDSLRTTHEGTEQMKESKVDMLTTQYENFTMKEGESIHDMHTRFSSITNELPSLGEPISSSKQDTSKKEAKKDKSLVLKIKSGDDSSEEDDMAYLTKRFQKIVRKHGGFKRRGNLPRVATTSDLCHKCGKTGHFIKDCPILKAENKEYQRPAGEKGKRRDLVLEKNARKAAADYVVKKALVVWKDSSSESEESKCPDDASMLVAQDDANIFDGMFALMVKSDDEDEEENDSMNISLDSLSEEITVLTVHMSVTDEQVMVLESENLELKEQLSLMIEKSRERKRETTSLQAELEASLNTTETRLALVLERNDQMERDLTRLKKELQTSLKWTSSTILLSKITSQSNYNRKGLGSLNITPPYNPHIKYVSVLDNLLCLHCGRNSHLKGDYPAWKAFQEKLKWVPKPNTSDLCCRRVKEAAALQGRGVSFGHGKKGYILGVGRVGKSLEDSIENVYYVSGLKYSLLSVSQICDKGNEVKRLGHVSSSLLNKLVSKDVKVVLIITSQLLEHLNRMVWWKGRTELWSLLNKTPYELLNNRKPKLSYLKTFGCNCFVLNKNKDDLRKFDPRSDEGIFVGYSSSSKTYRVFNKRTLCIEKSVHVIFDESAEGNLEFDGADPSLAEKMKKDDQPTMGPGLSHDASQEETHSLENDDFEDEEEQTVQPQPLASKPGSKTRNLVAFSAFISTIEPKSVKETMKDVDWVEKMGLSLGRSLDWLFKSIIRRRAYTMTRHLPLVARMDAIKILIAFVAFIGFKLFQMDVKSAFLSRDLKEELNKALYRLKQAPRAWEQELLIIQVYVDDIIFRATFEHMCEEFATLMGNESEMSMLGELHFFLGLQIKQTSNGTSICQEKYTKELLKKFHMMDSKPIDTSMGTNSKMGADEADPLVNQTMYRGIIGLLLYLTTSRLDIVFSVGMCARFQVCPRESHLKAAKRILRYLKKTGDLVLFYPAGDSFELVGYADADFAGYQVDRKSTSGMTHFLDPHSSHGIKQQLEDFGVHIHTIPLMCDNTSAVNLGKNLVQHKRTKHIDVRHHLLRDNVEKGNISM
ncbi:hypothetical protein KY284_033058 [Solanum tuberosum]|nr:hypothetical protein KY284_033058 [Solanum tuberosum]